MSAPEGKCLIQGTINHGYSFRHVFAVIKFLCTKAILNFSKEGIGMEQTDAEDRILTCLKIDGSLILDYKYDVIDDKGNHADCVGVGISIKDMTTAMSGCGKKQGFQFQISDSKRMCYKLTGNAAISQGQGASMISFQDVPNVDCEEPVFSRNENDPNYSLTTSAFAQICKSIDKQGGKRITITGFPKGFSISADKPNGAQVYFSFFGDCTPVQTAPYVVKPAEQSTTSLFNISINSKQPEVTKSKQSFASATAQAQHGASDDVKQAATKAVDMMCNIFDNVMKLSDSKDTTPSTSLIPLNQRAMVASTAAEVFTLILPQKEPGIVVRFGSDVIKAFGKLTPLCPDGITKFYLEAKKPLKVVTPISTYGKLVVYIKDYDPYRK